MRKEKDSVSKKARENKEEEKRDRERDRKKGERKRTRKKGERKKKCEHGSHRFLNVLNWLKKNTKKYMIGREQWFTMNCASD